MSEQNEKNRLMLAIIIVLLLAVSGMTLCYFQSKKETSPAPSISKEENKKETLDENEIPATPAPIPAPPEIWKTYTSAELGFSIKYPEMVYGSNSCIDKGSTEKQFYVPVRIFEDNKDGIFYIMPEYYYNANTKWNPVNFTTQIGLCEKINYSLELLKNEKDEMQKGEFWKPLSGWAISIKNVKNESELAKFIKDNYGSKCLVESKVFWKKQIGVYEIELNGFKDINGNDTDLGNAVCPVNYVYKILYIPEKNKIMSVKLGQECSFTTDYNSENYECYDKKMIDSFEFK